MAVIPTKNAPALIGYYLGVFSLIPLFGLVTALPAVICGIIGALKWRKTPEVAGRGHAISAIVMGIGGPLLWVGLFFLLLA